MFIHAALGTSHEVDDRHDYQDDNECSKTDVHRNLLSWIATVRDYPASGLLPVKHALGLVDHLFNLLLDLADLLLGLAGLTVSLTL